MATLREIWLKKSADKTKNIGAVRTYPWERVHHLGVILHLENETTYRRMLDMQERLESENENLRVYYLFYLNQKVIPDYLTATHHHFFTKKQLGWSGSPKKEVISHWLRKEFQVLINLHPDLPELRMVFKTSKTTLRVCPQGKFSESDGDMIFDVEKKMSNREKVETMIHYIKMLKK